MVGDDYSAYIPTPPRLDGNPIYSIYPNQQPRSTLPLPVPKYDNHEMPCMLKVARELNKTKAKIPKTDGILWNIAGFHDNSIQEFVQILILIRND